VLWTKTYTTGYNIGRALVYTGTLQITQLSVTMVGTFYLKDKQEKDYGTYRLGTKTLWNESQVKSHLALVYGC
jgi:hypothetical protein